MKISTQLNRMSSTTNRRCILLVAIYCSTLSPMLGCSDPAAPEQSLGPPNHQQSADSRTGCRPTQNAPYANGIPYLGVHGNPGNSDVIDCETPTAWTRSWHELKGLGMTQPNTFAPDGHTTYITTANPMPDGCRLFALDTMTGDVSWCRSYSTEIEKGAVEVDLEGHLYFTVGDTLISLDAQGDERWRLPLSDADGRPTSGWGVHFTPQGHVVTVTSTGRVYLADRRTGVSLAEFDIQAELNFVSPDTFGSNLDPSALLPRAVQGDIERVWGVKSDEEQADGFGAFLGSGQFVDNTVAVSERGDIYVIGGGPTDQTGALVQLRVEGLVDRPTLTLGWYAITDRGSATTPSISKGDGYIAIGDGAHPSSYFSTETPIAHLKVFDIEACDSNTDSDEDPGVCATDWTHQLSRGALLGSPAILDDGTVVLWEMNLAFNDGADAPDIVAVDKRGVVWSRSLPDNMDWTSVITVTRNHLIGTASRFEVSDMGLPGFKLPTTTHDRVVVLNRNDGEMVWYADLPDDSASTVTIGPDGSLYVTMLGIFSILAIDDRPTLGLIKFVPDYAGTSIKPPALPDNPTNSGGLQSRPDDAEETPRPQMDDETNDACFDVNLDQLEPCCDAGPAHCVDIALPDRFASQVETCPTGGYCVPDAVLTAVGSYTPKTCASVGGAPGACASKCLTEVAATAALLPQDVCDDGDVCVPCVSPLDGMETGVCGVLECGGGTAETEQSDEEPASEHNESASAEPSTDEQDAMAPPTCCGGTGTCLGDELVPDHQESSLKNCRREGHRELLCVPNDFLDPQWTPSRCTGNGFTGDQYEGVCLPDCLKLPLEFLLDTAPCADGYVCSPCSNPITGASTGAPGCQ